MLLGLVGFGKICFNFFDKRELSLLVQDAIVEIDHLYQNSDEVINTSINASKLHIIIESRKTEWLSAIILAALALCSMIPLLGVWGYRGYQSQTRAAGSSLSERSLFSERTGSSNLLFTPRSDQARDICLAKHGLL